MGTDMLHKIVFAPTGRSHPSSTITSFTQDVTASDEDAEVVPCEGKEYELISECNANCLFEENPGCRCHGFCTERWQITQEIVAKLPKLPEVIYGTYKEPS